MIAQPSVAISCQKCGGVARVVAGQDYHHCVYCSSLIQIAKVSVDRIEPTGTILDCQCPSCAATLQTGLIDGRRALFCGTCFGVLLRHDDFGSVVRERQAKRVGMEPAEPRPIDPAAFERRLKCPSCEKTMDTHPYYGPGNIVIDSCTSCGFIWLDHGELTRVEQASAARATASFAWTPVAQSEAERLHSVSSPLEKDEAKVSPIEQLADLLFL